MVLSGYTTHIAAEGHGGAAFGGNSPKSTPASVMSASADFANQVKKQLDETK